MTYETAGDLLTEQEAIYFMIDYIARVCWAFHSQNQIHYLYVYKRAFFNFKVGKITENEAVEIVSEYKKNHSLQAHSLTVLLGICSIIYKTNHNNFSYWCDGLKIIKEKVSIKRIGIKYNINNLNFNERALFNPVTKNLLFWLQYLEHIESLNLVIALVQDNIKGKNLSKNIVEIIDYSWDYFIDNPNTLITPYTSNQAVYNIVHNKFSIS